MNRFLPFEAIAAFRFMTSGLMQTLLIVIGVAVGVSVIVFMSALLSGLQSNLFKRTLNSIAQIVVSPPQEVARALRGEDARVIEACAGELTGLLPIVGLPVTREILAPAIDLPSSEDPR